MLPTELENLVGYYAYGQARYNLSEDIEFCAANRGMVPDSFLEHTLPLYGHGSRIGNALACYMVKNPLRTDNPYFPWILIDPDAIVFANTFYWWQGHILHTTYRKLKTYRKIFSQHLVRCAFAGRDFECVWNVFVNRYLETNVLMNHESYHIDGHGTMFEVICEQLGNAGYLTPMISLPPRPSQRSVLSQASLPHA